MGGVAREVAGDVSTLKGSPAATGRKITLLRNHPELTLENTSSNELDILSGDVVYCDPPYRGTTGYKTGTFDHDAFDTWAEEQVTKGAQVFVSEFNAPPHWEVVWENPERQV